MKITLITLGKTKEKAFQNIEAEYIKRLSGFSKIKLDIKVLDAEKPSSTVSDDQVKAREKEKILRAIPANTYTIALDEGGKEYTSVEFSQLIFSNINRDICFIIGGHLGLAKSVLQTSQKTVAFSRMTFTHQMVRMIFLEQVYRAVCIEIGKEYHR